MADRSDEARDNRAAGDILGLGGPASPGSDIPDNTTKTPRRHRRIEEDDPMTESSDIPRTPGATGIDMGSGGEGTDIE